MNIGADWQRNLSRKFSKYIGVFRCGHGKPKKAATHRLQRHNTADKRLAGFAPKIIKRKAVFPHGLNNHGMTASYKDGFNMIKAAYF
jgi:hypothetical protein